MGHGRELLRGGSVFQAVIPHMRRARRGHIINISSVGGLVGQPFNELYCAAKFAVEGFTESLTTLLPQHFGIKLSLIEPGGISTEFGASAADATMGGESVPDDEYAPIFMRYLAGFQNRGEQADAGAAYQTPEEIAEIVMRVIESEDPPLRVRTSEWAEDLCRFKTSADPDGTQQVANVIERFL